PFNFQRLTRQMQLIGEALVIADAGVGNDVVGKNGLDEYPAPRSQVEPFENQAHAAGSAEMLDLIAARERLSDREHPPAIVAGRNCGSQEGAPLPGKGFAG